MSQNKTDLTKNGILNILLLPISQKPKDVDYIFQVQKLLKKSKQNDNKTSFYYVLTLSDTSYMYCGFLYNIGDTTTEENTITEGDIIHITKVIVTAIHNGSSKIFVIKNYYILKKCSFLLKNLEFITDKIIEENSKNELNDNSINITENGAKINDNITQNQEKTAPPIKEEIQTIDPNIPIDKLSDLSTFSKRIHIYVQVIKKCEKKTFFNKLTKTQSKLLSFDIKDLYGNLMQVTVFEKACEKFDEKIKQGEVYEFSGGTVKLNDKKYSNIKGEYKLIFDLNTIIIHKPNDKKFEELVQQGKPINESNFVLLKNLPDYEVCSVIDCLVFVIDTYSPGTKSSKIGDINYRRVLVGDESRTKCELTLWKKFVDINIENGQILILKYIRINHYNGIRISSIDDSEIIVEPKDLNLSDKIKVLKDIIENEYKDIPKWPYVTNSVSSLTVHKEQDKDIFCDDSFFLEPLKYLKDIYNQLKLSKMNTENKPLSRIKATIVGLTHTERNYYLGCYDKNCKKKVIEIPSEKWKCNGCGKEYDKPYIYFTINIKVQDASDEQMIDLFGEAVAKLFDVKGEDYKKIIETKDTQKLSLIDHKLLYKTFYFVGKSNFAIYNNRSRKKFFAYRFEEIDEKKEMIRMIENIKKRLIK